MAVNGYQEAELVVNRAAVLLFGGSESDRRAWAEEAALGFEADGPLVEVGQVAALTAALGRPGGVVFVPDLVALGEEAQGHILQCLLHREERPKLVLGLPGPLTEVAARGLLRDDLAYRLAPGRLDLSTEGLKEAIRARRQKAAARPARAPPAPTLRAPNKRAGKR